MTQEGPPLFRPIPRRPFGVNFTSPTPPETDSHPTTPNPEANSQLLNPNLAEGESLSRSQSILNLTSSTLFGIFGPATPGKDRFYDDRDEPETPWGTGAQTPVKRRDLDDETYELLIDRSRALRRHSSTRPPRAPSPTPSELAWSMGTRVGLLFLLGMGYGALVARLRAESPLAAFSGEGTIDQPEHGWVYFIAWGISGVGLGALLPWFDGVWQMSFGNEEEVQAVKEKAVDGPQSRSRTDWSHAVRSIGAFVGIVFALVCLLSIHPPSRG